MPNDSTHRIINYLALSIIIVINFYIGLEQDFKIIIIFMGSYILGTEIFTPDLDTDSKPNKRLGILSFPIRKLSRHRGLGHNIFIGWFLKALYILFLCAILILIFSILGYDTHNILAYIDIRIIEAFLVGLFLSNAIHIIADKIS